MVTKRTFIQLGASAVAIAATPALAAAATPDAAFAAAAPGALRPERIIFDERFAASRAFGAAAAAHGAAPYAVRGNVEDLWTLWYRQLFVTTQSAQPRVLAGMTDHSTAFALELLAQDERMRPIYRAHHRLVGERTDHDHFGPVAMLRTLPSFADDATVWPAQVAQRLLSWPAEHASDSNTVSTVSCARSAAFGAGTLISWLIAPVARA